MSLGKILVVDDELDIVRAVTMRLRAAGYEVVFANDGVEALQMATLVKPDLVILDIGMPHDDGHTIAQRLLENVETTRVPIIFLTARTSEADRTKAYQAGAARYLTKPFKSQELLDVVSRALSSVRPSRPAAIPGRTSPSH